MKTIKTDPLKPLSGEVPIGTIPFAQSLSSGQPSRPIRKRITRQALLRKSREIKWRGPKK